MSGWRASVLYSATIIVFVGASEASAQGFQPLNDQQILRLFSDFDGAEIPDVGEETAADFWTLSFEADGSWEGRNDTVVGGNSNSAGGMAWGSWQVDGDRLCLRIDGIDTDFAQPFSGCFAVYLNSDDAVVAGAFPTLGKDRIVLKSGAFSEVARLVSGPVAIATSKGKDSPPATQARSAAAAEATHVGLKGGELRKLFSQIDDVILPDVETGNATDLWILEFRPDGSWDGRNDTVTGGNSHAAGGIAWGAWRIEDDRLCLETEGNDTSFAKPFVGCFGVSIEIDKGNILGAFPSLGKDRFILKGGAFAELTRLNESIGRKKPADADDAKPTEAKTTTETDRKTAKRDRRGQNAPPKGGERTLRSEASAAKARIEQLRLELELERLRQRNLAKQEQAGGRGDGETPLSIEAPSTLLIRGDTAEIRGRAAGANDLVRLEVNGIRIATEEGRFAADVPVALGLNDIRISAYDSRGNKVEHTVSVTRERDIPDIAFGKYYALVIGINDYESLPKLNTAVDDARNVAATLKDLYGYEVTLLENPTRTDIIDALDGYRELLTEDSNLLVYYAGHGWLDRQTGTGYWMPVNARSDRRSRWVSNATLTNALQTFLAKHVMVVADSCYSGTLTRSMKVPLRNRAYLERIAMKRTRVALSSGGLEPVVDAGGGKHSVFAAQFLKALRDNDGVLDGTQLFEKVRQNVILNAMQTPEYSDIRLAGHEGGDFLFVRRD